jgi:hypothetical protein
MQDHFPSTLIRLEILECHIFWDGHSIMEKSYMMHFGIRNIKSTVG